jgi:hypothetical protein
MDIAPAAPRQTEDALLSSGLRLLLVTMAAACGLIYMIAPVAPVPAFLSGLAGYACLCLLPGLALHFLLGRAHLGGEGQVLILGLSPVVAGVVVTLLLISGMGLPAATRIACLLFALGAMTGLAVGSRSGAADDGDTGVPLRVWIIAILAVGALSVFPQLGEVSRMRSDAWFHSAVVSELLDFGLPLTDPYFAGMPLQYMWLYHVYVGALSVATGVDPAWAMVFVNLQAVACLVIVTYVLARALQGNRPGTAASAVFMLVGLNCLFWAFLPFKLVKAAVGEVTGWDEVVRQITFLPLGTESMRAFVSVWKSQPFLLDKFIVATAFSLGVCLTVSMFLFTYKFMAAGGRRAAILACLSFGGLVLYHTPAGVAATAATGLALTVCFVSAAPPMRRRALTLTLCLIGTGVLTLPYLYQVASGKESHQLIPIGISVLKTSAVLISCAAALLLGLPWTLRFLRSRGDPLYFYGMLVVAALLVSLLIVLPGPNTFDKPPYFAFIPLAPLAGWSLYAIYRRGSTRGRRALIAGLCVLAIAPNTVLLYAAYVADPGPERVKPDEVAMYEWIGDNTPRDGIFLENADRVDLVVMGPRRQLWGHDSYAFQWGYEATEMAKRRALRDEVFSGGGITESTVAALAGYGGQFFVIVRHEDFGGDQLRGFERSPHLSQVYTDSCADVYHVLTPHSPKK